MSVIMFEKDYFYNPKISPTKKESTCGNTVYGSNKEIYQDLHIIMPITKTKFPVYLVHSKVTKKNYAMKVFAHQNGQPRLCFKNETRFASLQHPNVVRNLYFEAQRTASFEGVEKQISYTITEFAQHGDLYNFLGAHKDKMNEKLIRTYFRQLIQGLEYLHNNGVSHMDLKLANILIDGDYRLKIADFDMAHFRDDAIIISNGTQYYRAPEVVTGRCNNTKAADIFAAGIILFILKAKGVFPQFESSIIEGIDFTTLMYNNTSSFWSQHARVQKQNDVQFEDDFKELFISMTKFSPSDRTSIKAIKESSWYNGPYYETQQEIKEHVENRCICGSSQ